ncbi:hypothetical protein LOAG_04684 [Loa loa]|uniref:Uncharacterized protein n=1 Tax=Loa loa TaxID=7209 RepID=A0A1I7VFD5_LOALO|nr:hypothetical protein LOAG_04684 [Loa loa]EFO23799.1 hypothetical protein LOAG_04684 [Loa loa]
MIAIVTLLHVDVEYRCTWPIPNRSNWVVSVKLPLIKFRLELQTEPLDLSMSRMNEKRIGPSGLSTPEVSGRQVELNEIDQNDVSSLKLLIEELRTNKYRRKVEEILV